MKLSEWPRSIALGTFYCTGDIIFSGKVAMNFVVNACMFEAEWIITLWVWCGKWDRITTPGHTTTTVYGNSIPACLEVLSSSRQVPPSEGIWSVYM